MRTILSIFAALLLLCACKKSDYRDKYIGEYNFKVTEVYWTSSGGPYDTTVTNYIGSISYGKKKRDRDMVRIRYNQSDLKLVVSADNKLQLACSPNEIGSFANKDTINITWSSTTCNGSIESSGSTITLAGDKK